jgi:ABC-type sugar transport system substrate-binding protein
MQLALGAEEAHRARMRRFGLIKQSVRVALLFAALAVCAGPASAASTAAMPTCSAGDPVVWVNTRSHVYHHAGDPYYGKTSAGSYKCESAARASGAHLAGSKSSSDAAVGDASPAPTKKKHHHRAAALPEPTETP